MMDATSGSLNPQNLSGQADFAVDEQAAQDLEVGSRARQVAAQADVSRLTDYNVHGIVTIRLRDAPPHVLEAITQELGPPERMAKDDPDLVISFTDKLVAKGYLRWPTRGPHWSRSRWPAP